VNDGAWPSRGHLAGDGFRVSHVDLDRPRPIAQLGEQMPADEALSACDEDLSAHGARP
jgi:hypothetical protein